MIEATTVEAVKKSPQMVEIRNEKYLLVDVGGEIRAYRNICPHQYGPVLEGKIDEENKSVFCPWHGFEFSLDDGTDPLYGKSLPRVETRTENGNIYIKTK